MSDRIEELNVRIYSRTHASTQPSILFSPRPVATKYVKFPVVDDPVPSTVKLEARAPRVDFLPTDAKGPGALTMVDVESTLRSMDFALQRNGRAVYVPASKSGLYQDPSTKSSVKVRQPHPNLFAHVVSSNNGVPPNILPPTSIFNNVRLRTPA
jgi:hypothetical protein